MSKILPGRAARLGALALALAACASSREVAEQTDQELCVTGTYVEGVDVSYAQPVPIAWGSVKTVAGAFAFAKAAEGTAIADTAFPSSWPALRAAQITRGAYHFFKGSVDGVAQADYFLSVVAANGGFVAGDLPPAIDVEYAADARYSSLTGNVASDVARLRDTVQRIQARTGRAPILYTNNNTWGRLGNPTGFESYPVWLANWGATCTSLPPGLTNLKFWQYSSTGSVPGISGAVDRDRFAGTAADLAAFAGAPTTGGTCDNNVPLNGTACNPADVAAQFVCTSPGLPSAQQWTRVACSAGQTCQGNRCQPTSTPACGSGLYCAGSQIPGSAGCTANGQVIFCCPSGQQIVNGACAVPTPPPCGAGLFCALSPMSGAAACMSGSTLAYCCASGHTIVNGACSP